MVFHGWQRTGLTLVQLSQNNELLEGFFTMSELFVLADIDFLVLVCQKSPRSKTRSSSVAVLSRPKLAAVKQFLHLFTRNLFIMDYVGDVVCLPEVFCKFSNTLFASVKAESEIMNGYVPLNNLIPNLHVTAFLSLLGRHCRLFLVCLLTGSVFLFYLFYVNET